MDLSGRNHFEANIGGGIALMNARLNVKGELFFLNNLAMFGGGIAMDDSCLVMIKAYTRYITVPN